MQDDTAGDLDIERIEAAGHRNADSIAALKNRIRQSVSLRAKQQRCPRGGGQVERDHILDTLLYSSFFRFYNVVHFINGREKSWLGNDSTHASKLTIQRTVSSQGVCVNPPADQE